MLPDLIESLHEAGPMLILALVILVGTAFGGLAKRIHLPSVTGQILAGILVGKAGLDLFSEESLEGLQPLTHFALGLIAVTVGAHLNLRRLRNAGRRLFFLLVTESTITPLIVFLAIWGVAGSQPDIALLFATVAIATAPATVVTLVKETRSKGVFVKTLIAAVALNNMACIVLFEVARTLTRSWEVEGVHFGVDLMPPMTRLGIAVAIGAGVALSMSLVSRSTVRPERLATWAVVALVFTVGMATAFDVSPLLACLALGFVQTNISRGRDQLVDSVFSDFEPAILTVFFTLAGMHLSPEHLESAGFVAFLLFLGRFAGKLLSADLAMRFAHATDRVRANLGIALIPQAGVAVGLVLLIQEDPAFERVAGLFASVVLAVVAVNEIVGPLATRFALARAGEVDRDRMRLIDFLQEENIVTDFRARTKQEAIEKLVDLLITSHHLKATRREELLQSVLEREEEGSTCLGGGLAVPHGIVPEAQPMVGVMALSREGLELETPDHRPVHCMVLLGTAEAERDRHLQVLASLARTVGIDVAFQEQLFNAKSAAHAYELLHGEESEDFNYFLEED
jgi:PTS system fructose-specific IIC component